jgi:HPt (histidine-containing phosphotransfer) domain-containing protein
MELPNLSYIHKLSGGDKDFEQKIIGVIKDEFPEEKAVYYQCLKEKNYLLTAEIVHKLKHKISILGLEKGYEVALAYENDLKDENSNRHLAFETILQNITDYIKNF